MSVPVSELAPPAVVPVSELESPAVVPVSELESPAVATSGAVVVSVESVAGCAWSASVAPSGVSSAIGAAEAAAARCRQSGGQQASAADRVRAGHRPAGRVQNDVGLVVDGDADGVAVADGRTRRELGDARVQPLAEPGRERPDEFGGDGRDDQRQVRAHAIFSPTQRASSSGLRAATGMPAATS
ncbi:hypothetical protein GCM10020295_76880 [Streptomyces cinereospinus]